MKKKYMKPSVMAVKIQHSGIVCTSDPKRNVPMWDGEAGVKEDKGDGGSNNTWDEEW